MVSFFLCRVGEGAVQKFIIQYGDNFVIRSYNCVTIIWWVYICSENLLAFPNNFLDSRGSTHVTCEFCNVQCQFNFALDYMTEVVN